MGTHGRHAAASVEITELARTDYPLLGASCGHNFPRSWTGRIARDLTLELEPGWNVECTFYHVQAGASPKPVPGPTLFPTDTDAVVAAEGFPALPVALLLLL